MATIASVSHAATDKTSGAGDGFGATGAAENANVSVVVRLRPPDHPEDLSENWLFDHERNYVLIKDPLSRGRSEHGYFFNRIFTPESNQQQVYEFVAQPLVDRLLAGYNSCCFAYGQTGSGKTYCVFGEGNNEVRGMLPRSIEYLFEKIEQRAEFKEVGMVVSFVEIYLDQIRDLGRFYANPNKGEVFSPGQSARPSSAQARPPRPQSASSQKPNRPASAFAGSGADGRDGSPETARRSLAGPDQYVNQDLTLHESPTGQVYVQGLTLVPVKNITEVLDVVNTGVEKRATYETRLNANSSRSHTVFSISVVQKNRLAQNSGVARGVINFVDLAGSERLARSKSEGRRFQEAVIINSSLSALGKVVLALASDPKTVKHIPYRDSKLTRLLQNSLGGNSYTTLITTLNPAADNYEESLNSLAFADRCKNVKNNPVLNFADPQASSHERRVRKLLGEVEELKRQLQHHKMLQEAKKGAKGIPGELTESMIASGQYPDGTGADKKVLLDDEKTFEDNLAKAQQQAKARIQEEKKKTNVVREQRVQIKEMLKDARETVRQNNSERRRESIVLRESNRELELEVKKLERALHNTRGLAATHGNDRQAMAGHAEKVLREKEEVLKNMPSLLKQDGAILDAKEQDWEKELRDTEQKHRSQLRAVQEAHSRQVELLDKQYRQWLETADNQQRKNSAEYQQYHTAKRRGMQQYADDMLSIYEALQHLNKIAAELDDGRFPISQKIAIKPLQLPPGLRHRLMSDGLHPEKLFERLFQMSKDARRCSSHYQRMSNARALTHISDDFSSARGSDAGSDNEPVKDLGRWDSDAFASDLCQAPDEALQDTSDAHAALRMLNQAQLTALCRALRRRCNMSEHTKQAERNQIREDVLRGLGTHQRVEYIRHLEKDLERYQDKLQEEVDRQRKLGIAVESANRAGSRPSSAGPRSRPSSAGIGPSSARVVY